MKQTPLKKTRRTNRNVGSELFTISNLQGVAQMNARDGVNPIEGTKKSAHLVDTFLAEAEGFEPPVPCGTPVFKTGAIDQLCQTSGTAKVAHQFSNSSRFNAFSAQPLLNDN